MVSVLYLVTYWFRVIFDSSKDVNLWKLIPEDPAFVCLGTYSQARQSQHDGIKPPDLNGDVLLQHIRAIRRDLLVSVPVGDVSVRSLIRCVKPWD